jgi:hypothetical protein
MDDLKGQNEIYDCHFARNVLTLNHNLLSSVR